MKKIFYFSLGFLLLVLIFLGAYNFAFRNNVNDPTADASKKQQLKDQTEAQSKEPSPSITITNPVNERVLGATMDTSGMLYYFSLDDQSLKEASSEGKNEQVLMSALPGTPIRILWSPKFDQALILIKQRSNNANLWYFADLATKTISPLKPEISRMAWDNIGEKVFYQYTDPKNDTRTLNIANPDGSGWKTITATGGDSYLAAIPQSVLLSFWSRPNALEKTTLESISVTGDNRNILLTDTFGADFRWSPSGDKVLVGTSDEKGGHQLVVSLMNAHGGELHSLSLPTLISKTVWSKDNKTIYFALPGSLPDNAVLPNDYFDKKIITQDTFWKMDTATGKKARIVDLKNTTQSLDSIDLFLSPKEDRLFFTDRATNRLYQIDL